jgi:hypothetical protein
MPDEKRTASSQPSSAASFFSTEATEGLPSRV